MSLSIQAERSANDDEWLAVASACPSATFFHTPLWAKIYCDYAGRTWKPDARLVQFSDGKTAVLAFCCRRIIGLIPTFISSPAGNYGGWISSNELSSNHTQLLVERMYTCQNLAWRENPYEPLLQQMSLTQAQEDFTQAIDLHDGFEAMQNRASRAHGKAVRKAQRLGVTVRRATCDNDWQRHFTCYRSLRTRWNRASNDYRWKLFEILKNARSQHVSLWLAEKDDKLLSSVVCFYWNRHVVAWHGAASHHDYDVRPNNLMYQEIIKDAVEQGYDWFDLNPSGGNPGVVEFKEHLGAVQKQSRVVVRRSSYLAILSIVRQYLCK